MAHENAGNYSAKHLPDKKLNLRIAEDVKLHALDGRISCNSGHKIAGKLKVPPTEVGIAIDLLEMRINKCQLGLFGYSPENKIVKPAGEVSPELEKTILKRLTKGRLHCSAAWEIAKIFNIPKMEVSSTCEALQIKISACQLGAF
jgi:hypothetical protein